MKAVDGEMMKLGVHVLDDLHTPATVGGQKVAPSNGSADSSHPSPGGPQEVGTKGVGGVDKFAGPGAGQEVVGKHSGKIKLSGKHPID